NLIALLEAPRFFVERDEVVLSANVHNYLAHGKNVKAELIVPADLFEFMGESAGKPGFRDQDGNEHFTAEAKIGANGEHRFDWPLRVVKPGLARITVKALTDEESDGMRMTFPVLVHGIKKTVAQSGSIRGMNEESRTMDLNLPSEIDPEQS